MRVVGFDFGTTNSLVSIIQGDRAVNFLEDDGLPTPSVVCYEGTRTIAGREAKRRLGDVGLGVKGNIVCSPKRLLGKRAVFVDGIERSPVDIVADVVKHVTSQAVSGRRRDLSSIERAVVTIPITMDGGRRQKLRDAFRRAGVGIVQFVHEPLAALYGYFRSSEDRRAMLREYEGKLLFVFDWGGGTLDLTLCRLIDDMLVQISNAGTDEVGGDHFDDAIRNHILGKVRAQAGFEDTVLEFSGASTRLLHHCERAKIDLSERDSVEIYIGNYFRSDVNESLSYSLSRLELEELASGLLNRGFLRVEGLLKEARVSGEEIAMCLVVGGMANMPAIRARLHELFGPSRVRVAKRSATLIAEGAAWVAHDEARLCLAKDVELALARNESLPIIKAGTRMPLEGDAYKDTVHLYCADPRDGIAKFQLRCPVQPGRNVQPSDDRRPLKTLSVEVDGNARPFEERLELTIHIDDNLILRAQADSTNFGDRDSTQVYHLEFGLTVAEDSGASGDAELPATGAKTSSLKPEPEGRQEGAGIGPPDKGAVTLRANIAARPDKKLVPGELLYSYDPVYFDSRANPPESQVRERLYYELCAVCRRRSNDPRCRCQTRRQSTVTRSIQQLTG